MVTLTVKFLEEKLATYDEKGVVSSSVLPNEPQIISGYKALLKDVKTAEQSELNEEQLSRLIATVFHHDLWGFDEVNEKRKTSATARFLYAVRQELAPSDYNIIDVISASQTLSRHGFLSLVNFKVLNQGGGQHAFCIAIGLDDLEKAGLLTGEQGRANVDMLTQGDVQHAEAIAAGLIHLQEVGLLTGEQAQANRKALTQGGSEYAAECIASLLEWLRSLGLLTGEKAQANRDRLTQGGGQYVRVNAIGSALDDLEDADLLVGEQAQENFDALTQGGVQYVEAVARGLQELFNVGLLKGRQDVFDALTRRLADDVGAQRSPAIFAGIMAKLACGDILDEAHFKMLLYENSAEGEEKKRLKTYVVR
jgi:hypothetical protein